MKIFKLRNIIVLTVVVCFISGCSSEYNNDKTEPNRITVESQVTEKEQSVKKEEPKPIEKKKEPTVGMSESEIENTKLGKATSIINFLMIKQTCVNGIIKPAVFGSEKPAVF